MILRDVVTSALATWPGASPGPNEVAVPTHCLYPSNAVVHAYVIGGADTYKVTDGGGALDEFENSGGVSRSEIAIIRSIARGHGLDVSDRGVIHSGLVDSEQLVGTIVLIANASKEAAHALEFRNIAVPKRNFREMLAKLIDSERVHGLFLDVSLHKSVVGASTKAHRFDFDISLTGGRRLLLDTVVPEASSINSVLAANLDIKAASLPNTLQRIIYDDEEEWRSADLALLGLGATVVPFMKLRPVLSRLAA